MQFGFVLLIIAKTSRNTTKLQTLTVLVTLGFMYHMKLLTFLYTFLYVEIFLYELEKDLIQRGPMISTQLLLVLLVLLLIPEDSPRMVHLWENQITTPWNQIIIIITTWMLLLVLPPEVSFGKIPFSRVQMNQPTTTTSTTTKPMVMV
jgi:hypothetical protein